MRAHAIKYKGGWFIRDLPELDMLGSNVVALNVDLSKEQYHEMGYKELQGVALMERYVDKQSREVPFEHEVAEVQKQFREIFGVCVQKERFGARAESHDLHRLDIG